VAFLFSQVSKLNKQKKVSTKKSIKAPNALKHTACRRRTRGQEYAKK